MGGSGAEGRVVPPFLVSAYPLGKEDLGSSTGGLEAPLGLSFSKGEGMPYSQLSPRDADSLSCQSGSMTMPGGGLLAPRSLFPPPCIPVSGQAAATLQVACQNSALPSTCTAFSEPQRG